MDRTRLIVVLGALASMALPALAKMPVDVEMPKSARAGETVTVCVKTEKDAKCKIEAQDAGLTQALKLVDQTADASGKAQWKFDIPKDFKANEMPVIVTVKDKSNEEKVTKAINIDR